MEKVSGFAARLKEAMNEKGMRQIDLLRACSLHSTNPEERISQSLLSQYVNGSRVPRSGRLRLIARVLGVRAAWLLGYDVEKDPEEDNTDQLDPLYEEDDDFYKAKIEELHGQGWNFEYHPETGLFSVHRKVKGVQEISYMDTEELKLKLDLLEDYTHFLLLRPLKK